MAGINGCQCNAVYIQAPSLQSMHGDDYVVKSNVIFLYNFLDLW